MDSQRILIIQTAFLGDAILTLPLIQKYAETNPDAVIDVLCIPSTKEIFEHSPFVTDVFSYDKREKQKSLLQLFNLSRSLKSKGYYKIISPHRSVRTSLLIKLIGVKDTVGFDKASMSFVYSHRVKYNIDDHEVKRNLALIGEGQDSENWRILPKVEIHESAKQKVDEYLNRNSLKEIIAVAPGSVWATKVYPKDYFREIISYLLSHSFSVVLIGGIDDEILCSSLADGFDERVVSVAGKFSIIESIELLKRCRLIISNDSAPTHMGMCADIPTLTLYCSTLPAFGFYPYSEKSSWLSFEELDCKPCGIHGFNKCPINTFECASKLTPSIVTNKISEMLKP